MLFVRNVVSVAISDTSFGYDKRYKYIVPVEYEGKVFAGTRIIVPFGNGNRKRIALVLKVESCDGLDISKFKPIHSLIDNEPLLNAEMMDLLLWIREMTFCTYYEAFKTLIPSGLSVQFTDKYKICEMNDNYDKLSEKAKALYCNLQRIKTPGLLLDSSDKNIIQELLNFSFIEENNTVKRKIKDETIKMVKLSDKYIDTPNLFNISVKQKKIIDTLIECDSASIKEICYLCGVTTQLVNNMIKKGSLESYDYEIVNNPDVDVIENCDDIILSDEQLVAFSGIKGLIDNQKPDVALLYGITGSGKTSVFIKLIEYVLSVGKTVIMMIPEISLTPQTVSKFQNLFGNEVAVMHSSLSLSQRLNEYKRIKQGNARIVIGTRSAVFAPLENIGLIVIDEEAEHTYKSESSPRYNAKEIAKKRCVTHNAVLLLASATPSIESFYYAKTNRYKLFELKQRYSGNNLPTTEIIDLQEEPLYGSSTAISEKLVDEINYNLEHKQQVILLLNRRGYHTYVSCCDCRKTFECPNCSIPLTYHKKSNRLVCHYCGYSKELVEKCDYCGGTHIKMTGLGTQKIEDEISNLFPDARILRMDADTTYSRYAYEKNFNAFKNCEYDIMVGTQMIAKGLDFPNVTLVGVLSVDNSLYAGDFRSYERTFSLITQVIGRCGRGDKEGRAVIQTYVPEHYVLNLAAMQNYEEFYEQEISLRKAMLYPPFCDTCLVGFSSTIENCVETASKCFILMIKNKIKDENCTIPLRVLGPSKGVYEKTNGKFRYRIIIKCKNNNQFRLFIKDLYIQTFKRREFSKVQTYIDINGDI